MKRRGTNTAPPRRAIPIRSKATVHVPIRRAAQPEENGQSRFASVNVSRARAKTVTYEVVTGGCRNLAPIISSSAISRPAAGLTAFSIVIAPLYQPSKT
jgi:hypothetical protein